MINKREFIWNVAASLCAASLSFILPFIINLINGIESTGIFSITFATATVLNAMADFGMRVYHVTDVNRKYSFGNYLTARRMVNVAMIASGLAYVLFEGYSKEKAVICLGLVFFRFVDGISETYQGEFQLNGRLDIAGKSVCFRTIGSVIIFFIVDLLTRNLMLSIITLALTNLLLFFIFDKRMIRHFINAKISFQYHASLRIIKDCFPLFFSTFLNNYIINAPKYAIDKLLTNELQAEFTFINTPTFTINLCSIFVLKPMLRTLGMMWNEKKYKEFLNVIIKMLFAIVIVTIGIEAICFFIGIPILSVVYQTRLDMYKMELLILLLSGGFSALAVMLFYVLSTMRAQSKVLIAYVVSAMAGLIIPEILVKKYDITGAAISSVVLLFILTSILTVIFLYEWRNKAKETDK